jgi:hypothetical protein
MILQRHLADTLAGRREVRVEHRWCREGVGSPTPPQNPRLGISLIRIEL